MHAKPKCPATRIKERKNRKSEWKGFYCRSFGGNFKVCTKPIEVIDEAVCLRPKKMSLEGSGRFGKACGKEP